MRHQIFQIFSNKAPQPFDKFVVPPTPGEESKAMVPNEKHNLAIRILRFKNFKIVSKMQ